MALSTTNPFFALPGATVPLAGTEDMVVLQGQNPAQATLGDVMAGLVAAKGGKVTVTGSKGGNAALTSLIAALVTLGFITDSTS